MATTTPLPEIAPPKEDMLYEVVNGQVVERTMGADSTWIASMLNQILGSFALTHQLGRAVVEMRFRIDRAKDLQRRPDMAFVPFDRWPRSRQVPEGATWDVVPDLAVEIISPSNTADGVMAKVEEYFRAGPRLVWAIDPNQCQVYAYESPTSVRILQVGDDLDGGAVVPGFRLPIAVLFEDEPEAPPTP
ncbi:MAG TPA: Uma2 family endonuclease [Isosphaeraceae bacterium]|nr:Uma2 family endonuclease [Isosphaeraceae bacterium]